MDGEVTFSNPSFRNTLWTMRNEFNDATLICNGRKSKFGCHKIVLASVSGIFRDMLRKSNEIDLGEVSNEDCHRFLKFIYLGKIKMRKLDQDRMTELGKRFAVKGVQRARTASSSSSSSSSSESNSSDCDVDANKSIFDLPAELLINILVRLPTHDLLVNVAAVSKYFYQLAKDPMVHVKVFLPANIDLGPAVNFLRKALKAEKGPIRTIGTKRSCTAWYADKVTRLGYFSKVLGRNFLAKVAQIITNFLVSFDKNQFLSKN